jgi:hypothetical protein
MENNFPRGNGYQGPPPNQISLTTLDPTNMLEHEFYYYFQFCDISHDEITCAKYIEIMKSSSHNSDGYLYTCNTLSYGRKMFHLSQENMQRVKDKSIEPKRDNALFGENPSPKEIKKMYAERFNGITYQRKIGNPPQGDQ